MPILDRSRFGAHFFQDILANIWHTILYYKKEKKIQGCQLNFMQCASCVLYSANRHIHGRLIVRFTILLLKNLKINTKIRGKCENQMLAKLTQKLEENVRTKCWPN